MSDHYRHHRASRDVQIVIVPVLFEGGSPKLAKRPPPPAYPVDRRGPWRPQRAIPAKRKVEALRHWLDQCRRQDEAVRSMLSSSPGGLKASTAA